MKKTKVLQIICVLLFAAIIVVIAFFRGSKETGRNTYDDGLEDLDSDVIVLSDGRTEVSFADVILSQPEETRKLVVYEQEATAEATIQTYKIIDVKPMRQNQKVKYTATGSFIVELDALTAANIIDDKENKKLTIKIGHPELDTIEIDPNEIVVEDPEKGILAFGDLTLTVKDYVTLEKKLQKELKEKFDTSANGQEADDIALRMVKGIYEPVVKAVDDDYSLEIVFN